MIVLTNRKWYQGIANALRAKLGKADSYLPGQMPEVIREMAVYGILSEPPAVDYGSASGTVKTDDAHYAAIAGAIREKLGTEDRYTPAQMAQAIAAFDLTAPLCSFHIYFGPTRRNFTRLELHYNEWGNIVATYTPADMYNVQNLRITDLPLGGYGFRLYESTGVTEKSFDMTTMNPPYNLAFSFG